MRRRTVTAIAVSLVAVFSVNACTGEDDGADQPEPPLDPVVMATDPALTDPRQVDYPLGRYVADDDRVHLLERAKAIVGQACMRRFGMDLPIPEPPGARPFPLWDRYGIWNASAARELGYTSPGWGGGGEAFFGQSPDPDWSAVAVGSVSTFNGLPVPEDGCQGEALRALGYEDLESELLGVPGRLLGEARSLARQHSAVVPLIDAWAECMRQQGWEFTGPLDSVQRFNSSPYPPSEEIPAALADIECKRQTGLLRAWVAADVAYQRVLADQHAGDLRAFMDLVNRLIANANEIIAGHQ